LNSGHFDEAIREGNTLVLKYPDFDLIYKWLGVAYRQNGQLDEAAVVVLRGLAKSRRKALLLTELGDTEWQRHDVDSALYWLAQAIHCANPLAHMAYLLAGYIAEGRGMEDAKAALIERADSLNPGPALRLSPELWLRLVSEPSRGDVVGMITVLERLSSSLA
jgi:tetratricopeptide (TPR) repeat protein